MRRNSSLPSPYAGCTQASRFPTVLLAGYLHHRVGAPGSDCFHHPGGMGQDRVPLYRIRQISSAILAILGIWTAIEFLNP